MSARSQKGFSLIEAIIALFITGAIILVIANIPNVLSLVTGSKSESKVREVVAKKIEDLRISGFDSLADGSQVLMDPKLNSLNNVSGIVLTETCPADLCPDENLAENIKKITITITWSENSQPKRFSATTLVAKGGLK